MLSSAILASVPALHAQSLTGRTAIQFGRISFQAPGRWQVNPSGKTLTAQSNELSNTAMIIAGPSDLRTWDARGYLEHGIVNMEKSEGRQLLKAFPQRAVAGLTKNGVGFAFQSRVTKDRSGSVRYAAYYGFAAGARYQTVIFLTDSAAKLELLMKSFAASFDGIQVGAPGGRVQPVRGQTHLFFNYTINQPPGWQQQQSPYANLSVYRPGRLPGSNYVFGDTNNFVVEYELQPSVPVSPVAALESYLTKRSTTYYKSWRSEKHALKIARIDEMQLPDGRILVGMALQQTNDDRFYLGGWLVRGPDYSLIVASGFKLFAYDLIKRGSTAAVEHRAWYAFYESLAGLAASVNWKRNMKRNQPLEQALMKQRQFRYHRESSIVGAGISVFSSNRVNWDFYPNNRAAVEMDKFTSFNDYEFNPGTNRNEVSSGYLTREDDAKHNGFQVWTANGHNYIILMRPAGVATFHPVTVSPRFTIDGFVHGCCR